MKSDYIYHLYTSLLYENKRLKKEIKDFKSGKKYIKLNNSITDLTKKYHLVCSENTKKDNTISDLKKDIDEFKRQLEELKDDINLNEKLKYENEYLKSQLNIKNEKNGEKDKTIQNLKNEIDRLKETNKKNKKRAEMNSSNSSYSSSFDRFDNKPVYKYNSRTKSNKGIGGQFGHAHHPRKEIVETKDLTILKNEVYNKHYDDNQRYVKTGRYKKKQLVDIILIPDVHDYCSYEYKDTLTGKCVWSEFPVGIKDETNYGNNLKTLITYLSVKCNMSINNIQEFILSATNNVINVSCGFISNLIKNASKLVKEDIISIENDLLASKYCHFDLTACNINGKQNNILNIASNKASLYYLTETKSQKDLDETLLSLFENILIHDHVVGFYKYGHNHQECLAHVIRYLKQAQELEKEILWHTKMLLFIQKIIDAKKKGKEINYKEIEKEYDEILKEGEREYEKVKLPKYIHEGKTLLKRMEKYKDNHLLFLKENIPYTNNLCERMLRGFKRKQKQAIVFRSNSNVESICLLLSIINTAKINNTNPYFKILELYNRFYNYNA